MEKFAQACYNLGKEVGIAMTFKDQGMDREKWMAASEKLSYLAYEDQCSPANPRVPMVKDMQEIIEKSYDGEVISYKR